MRGDRKRRTTARALSLGLLCSLLLGCAGRQRTNLPELTLPRLDGAAWQLTDEADQIVVLVFFASFDNSSVALSTALERLHITYRRRGVRVIGVAMDPPDARRRRQVVEAFCALNNLTFDVVLSTEELASGQTEVGRIPTIPATVIFNRQGDPVASATGMFRYDEMTGLLDALIEGRSHPLLVETR